MRQRSTLCPFRRTMSRKYLELGTESLSRWGTAVWIHRQRGILACDGRPVCVDEHDIEVFAESPKLLSLKVSVAGVCVFVIAAHCPHEAKGAEYVTFLEHLEQQLQRTQGADLVLCGIDLNGPGEVNTATGPVVCGEPDVIGKCFAQLLVSMRMWAPATFRHRHPGEDCTFVHPTGSERRIDFIAVGDLLAGLVDFSRRSVRELLCGGPDTIEIRSCLMKGGRSLLRHVPVSCSPRGRRRQMSITCWSRRPRPMLRTSRRRFGISGRPR